MTKDKSIFVCDNYNREIGVFDLDNFEISNVLEIPGLAGVKPKG